MDSKDLDLTKEMELFFNPENGAVVQVEFKSGKTETFTGITEFHWRYPSLGESPRVAIESDIQCTGWTYDINEIESFRI